MNKEDIITKILKIQSKMNMKRVILRNLPKSALEQILEDEEEDFYYYEEDRKKQRQIKAERRFLKRLTG